MKIQNIAVDAIRIDTATQNRLSISEDTVQDYCDISAASNGEWPFPPCDVFFDGSEHHMADGFHRLLGAQRAKRPEVPCKVHTGTAHDARIWAMKANDKNGMRLTRADKDGCVAWLLHNGGRMTQRAIAEAAGVTVRTVQRVKADLGKPKPTKKAKKKTKADSEVNLDWPEADADPFSPASQEEEKQKRSKPTRQVDRTAWLKEWRGAIGPVIRLVDKIAKGVGEKGCESHKCVQEHLGIAVEEMKEWLGK